MRITRREASVMFFTNIIIGIVSIIGYVLNFWNVIKLKPQVPLTGPIMDVVNAASVEWVISVVGLIIPPIGVLTGYLI